MSYGSINKAGEAYNAYSAGLGMAGLSDPRPGDARQLEVPHQIDAMDRNLNGLVVIVQDLEARLCNSILRPEPPVAGGTKDQLRAAISAPVATHLQSFNDKLVSVCVSIESMLARLEA